MKRFIAILFISATLLHAHGPLDIAIKSDVTSSADLLDAIELGDVERVLSWKDKAAFENDAKKLTKSVYTDRNERLTFEECYKYSIYPTEKRNQLRQLKLDQRTDDTPYELINYLINGPSKQLSNKALALLQFYAPTIPR